MRLIYFNIWKENIALLLYYECDITLIETLNDKTNYFDQMPITNSVSKVLPSQQRELFFFIYYSKTNYCCLFNDSSIYSERQFNHSSISWPTYCEAFNPVSKEGFKIPVQSPCLCIQHNIYDNFILYCYIQLVVKTSYI